MYNIGVQDLTRADIIYELHMPSLGMILVLIDIDKTKNYRFSFSLL